MMKNKIGTIVFWIIVIVILVNIYNFYKLNNFNEFIRSELNLRTSEFKRDSQVKYSKNDSYKIISDIENDATFYKKVKVKKDTPYKVTCMVKKEDFKSKVDNSGIGAQISIIGKT